MLGVTYKTAWFMKHRIRAAMASGDLTPMAVKARSLRLTRHSSEKKKDMPVRRGFAHKHAVMTLIELLRDNQSKNPRQSG